ncbi:MAG: hypothetical protein KU28_00290 [Sulfurovum sp. PC08-66]|nr:MAG: hypothetical protein KU28_00290 [Sulfurovum sp. PC08-66]KIM12409.1 MAG: hypothetical protein KU37_00410 [Sulfuricurvum sp. PC08-66]
MDYRALEAIFGAIENAKHLLLITHINPDADTLCSALAFYDVMWRRQKKCTIFNARLPLPVEMGALPHASKIVSTLPQSADLAIAFDCGSFDRLGIEALSIPLVNIDHHLGNSDFGTYNIVDASRASTTQLVYEMLAGYGFKLSSTAAQLLFTGLMFDSLSFGTNKVDAMTLDVASKLVALGASAQEARARLYESYSLARMRLLGQMLGTLQLFGEGRIAVCYATQAMFDATGAHPTDSDEAVRVVMSMGVVHMAIVMRQERPNFVKVSLRTKGDEDMSQIAACFGGGGHAKASGFGHEGTIEALQSQLVEILESELA